MSMCFSTPLRLPGTALDCTSAVLWHHGWQLDGGRGALLLLLIQVDQRRRRRVEGCVRAAGSCCVPRPGHHCMRRCAALPASHPALPCCLRLPAESSRRRRRCCAVSRPHYFVVRSSAQLLFSPDIRLNSAVERLLRHRRR